jgi:23S rRNA (cytosine1962-C5)-methyltransferase
VGKLPKRTRDADRSEEKQRGPDAAVGAIVNRRAADRLRSGHLWVYANEVESIQLPDSATNEAPALLPVADQRNLLLGTALTALPRRLLCA